MRRPQKLEGTYRQRGKLSYTVVGVYLFLIVVLIFVLPRGSLAEWALLAILAFFLFFLVRYLSTTYSLNDTHLHAWRFPGGRRIPIDSVRQIEYSSMRDLGPSSFVGSWGWRGRMWSPEIGHFDAIYTDPGRGILVTGDGVPIYISPDHLEEFARELSRRARSYSGQLSVDVGNPRGPPPSTSPPATASTEPGSSPNTEESKGRPAAPTR